LKGDRPGDNRGIFDTGGTGTLFVDGNEVDKWDETFDVGVDTRTPIDDRDYQVPFRFTGKLVKPTVDLHPIRGTLSQIIEFKWKTWD